MSVAPAPSAPARGLNPSPARRRLQAHIERHQRLLELRRAIDRAFPEPCREPAWMGEAEALAGVWMRLDVADMLRFSLARIKAAEQAARRSEQAC